jgi:ATP-dependent Clp protease ATP-binding subunit ClpB
LLAREMIKGTVQPNDHVMVDYQNGFILTSNKHVD